MAAASLSGSSFPLSRGGYVVTVECPNEGSHARLMQALQNIVPAAFEPTPQPTMVSEKSHKDCASYVCEACEEDGCYKIDRGSAYLAGFEPNEDGVIVPGCATGVCGLD